MRHGFTLAIVLGVMSASATCVRAESGASDARIWTSKRGATVEAAFVKSEHGSVILRKPDGELITIKESALSEDDRAYIADFQRKITQAGVERAAKAALEKMGLSVGQQAVNLPDKLAKSETLAPQYFLYLPPKYTEQAKWPLVLFLHGGGEKGTDINSILKHGPPKLAKKKDFPFILISPQCRPNMSWQSRDLIKLVEHLESTLNVDPNRIYITGLSIGGFGTWSTIIDHPDKFAAAVPIAGGAPAAKASAIKDLPIWSFHGDQDTAVPIAAEMEMAESLRKLNKHFKFTVYEGCGHDSWTRTYANQEVWDWMLAQKRK